MRILPIIATLLAVSCASHINPGSSTRKHSHVWVGQPERNLWSYQRVATIHMADGGTNPVDAFAARQLRTGEALVFENGTKVAYDRTTLRVANAPFHSSNAILDPDGTLQHGSFIATFK